MSGVMPSLLSQEVAKNRTPNIYFAHDMRHLDATANHLMHDEIVAFPYNGPYAFFGRYGSEAAKAKIYDAKERPEEKKLVTVAPPEEWHRRIDFSKIPYTQDQIAQAVHGTHALGMILPVRKELQNDEPTEVMMWTDYEPLMHMYTLYSQKGGVLLHATSVNKSGMPTNIAAHEVLANFREDDIAAIVQDVVHQPELRRMGSTSILDMTKGSIPILYRLGNVPKDEIDLSLIRSSLPESRASETLLVTPQRNLTEIVS